MGLRNLPSASGEAHARAFERCGCTIERARNHIVISKPGCPHTLSIPNHPEVSRVLLQRVLKTAGISESDYLAAFKKKKKRKGA